MKRFLTLLLLIFIPLFLSVRAPAAETGEEPSNVTITVVMPDSEPAPSEEPAASSIIKVYPSDVTENRNSGGWQIIKTYELAATERPEDIPRDSFERDGWNFTLTDIIRKETANAETREHTETATLNTGTKEIEKILPLLSPTMEYTDSDGFTGLLSLDVKSIKVETAGTASSNYTMTVTRKYPRLSANDTRLVPKTVSENGKTYTLAGVDWLPGNNTTVDYEALPEYYTAIAAYTATGTSTWATGYVTTAEYSGTLAKLSQGKTVYTAYFTGEEIITPLEMISQVNESAETAETDAVNSDGELPENGGNSNNNYAWLAVIPCLMILAGGAYYFIKKKGKNQHEKNHNTASVAHDNGDFGGTRSGG